MDISVKQAKRLSLLLLLSIDFYLNFLICILAFDDYSFLFLQFSMYFFFQEEDGEDDEGEGNGDA